MSQAEVERLLAVVENQTAAAGTAPDGTPGAAGPLGGQLEFPVAAAFSEPEFRVLRMRHEEYIKSLAGRLAAHLRMECGLQLTKLEALRFKAFTDGLSNPTHLAVFRLEPWKGTCLMDVPPRLALSLVDRELGGPGVFEDEARDLTRLETQLLSRFIDLIAGEWCASWGQKVEFRPAVIRHETCPRYLNTHAPDETLLVLGMELRMGEVAERIHMAFPLPILEPLLAKLNAEMHAGEVNEKTAPAAAPRWNPAMDDLPVRLTAQWQGVELTARELGELKPGDVLRIAPGTADRIELLLESAPKYQGSLGTLGPNWAVKIVEAVRK